MMEELAPVMGLLVFPDFQEMDQAFHLELQEPANQDIAAIQVILEHFQATQVTRPFLDNLAGPLSQAIQVIHLSQVILATQELQVGLLSPESLELQAILLSLAIAAIQLSLVIPEIAAKAVGLGSQVILGLAGRQAGPLSQENPERQVILVTQDKAAIQVIQLSLALAERADFLRSADILEPAGHQAGAHSLALAVSADFPGSAVSLAIHHSLGLAAGPGSQDFLDKME